MDIQELKEKKSILEARIKDLLSEFQTETKVYDFNISISKEKLSYGTSVITDIRLEILI